MTQNPSAIQSFDNVRLTMRDFRYANPIAQDDNYYTESDTDLVVTTSSANPPLLANDFSYEGVTAAPIIVAHPTRGIISSLGSNGTFTYLILVFLDTIHLLIVQATAFLQALLQPFKSLWEQDCFHGRTKTPTCSMPCPVHKDLESDT